MIVKLDLLIQQIQSDFTKRLQTKVDESFPFIISTSNAAFDLSLNEDFFHAQILFNCLLQMKTLSTDKSELILQCKNEYYNDPKESALIDEFQKNYTSNQAIWWYTRNAFLARILNKAFYTKNLDLLFLLGFFIRDIQENLHKNQCKSSFQVYTGQLMSIDELQTMKNSIGESMMMNKFFSAYFTRKQVISHLNEYPVHNDCLRILFEITADSVIDKTKPFADITPFVYLSQEQQCLFSLGSIFRIEDVIQDKKNNLWIVKLIFTTIRKEYDATDLIVCIQYLQQMKKTDHVEKFFLRLLKELPNDHPDISQCFHGLAILAFFRNDYDLSLQWYQKLSKELKTNDPNLVETFYSIGCVHQKRFEHQLALKFYQKALDIWQTIDHDQQSLRMAECLNNMGCIYELERYYSKALACHEQALSIRGQHQVDLGSSYNNIANIYLSLGEYETALQNYNYAFAAKSKSLSTTDPSLAITLRNIGLVYEEDGNVEEASKFYRRAALMFEQIYPATHVYNMDVQEDIRRVSSGEN